MCLSDMVARAVCLPYTTTSLIGFWRTFRVRSLHILLLIRALDVYVKQAYGVRVEGYADVAVVYIRRTLLCRRYPASADEITWSVSSEGLRVAACCSTGSWLSHSRVWLLR